MRADSAPPPPAPNKLDQRLLYIGLRYFKVGGGLVAYGFNGLKFFVELFFVLFSTNVSKNDKVKSRYESIPEEFFNIIGQKADGTVQTLPS